MEYTPEIASTLDVYADEISTSSDISPIVQVDCMNEEIKMIINTLLYNVLNIEFNMFGWARNLCKYGDYYLYLDIDDQIGITMSYRYQLKNWSALREQIQLIPIMFSTSGLAVKKV